MTVSPPPVGPNLNQWARATRAYLQRWLPRLQWKRQDDNPSDDGVILWDGERSLPVVSKGGTFRTIPLTNIVFVEVKGDLPTPAGGVITLEDNTAYFFTAAVDLGGDRIMAGDATAILGISSEVAAISSTGLTGAALISATCSLEIRDIMIVADQAFNLDGISTPGANVFMSGVSIEDTATIGTIKDYDSVIISDGGYRNSDGLTFDGTIGTIAYRDHFFDADSTGTVITVAATATITRRFRIIYSAFVIGSGETALDVSTSATIPVESYILESCNFSGAGTFIAGVQHNDNKASFFNNVGISNSANVSSYYMNGNTTATSFASTGVPVKIAGTTTSVSVTQRFSNTSNRATYTGAISRSFKVDAIASVSGASNRNFSVYIAVNGVSQSQSKSSGKTNSSGDPDQVFSSLIVTLSQNDYVEAWVSNDDSTASLTVRDLNVLVGII